MPHRVTSFLRPPRNSLEKPVASAKKTIVSVTQRRDQSSRTTGRNLRVPDRVFSYASSGEDDAEDSPAPAQRHSATAAIAAAVTAATSAMATESRSNSFSSSDGPRELFHHRISFPGMHFGRLVGKESHANAPASLRWELESPPIVFYGDVQSSTGALVSGQLFLDIKEEELEIESFGATLSMHVTQKRPFAAHCHDCVNQYTELNKWTFLQQSVVMKRGQHTFPFSVLLPGHLPASLDGTMASIAYEFKAEAIPKSACHPPQSQSQSPPPPIRLEKVLHVKRSLQVPEFSHHSVRVFPPTNIKASVHYPQVIHPTGGNTLTLKLDGIAAHSAKVNTMEYWKLKKLTWQLEETAKTVAPTCDKHVPKDAGALVEMPNGKKGIAREDTRVIGEKTMFSGWKSSYSGAADSNVEIELEYQLSNHAKFNCDIKKKDGGIEVTHQLMVEMVVSQEWAPINKPSMGTQTGIGRILRMHFNTVLTERGGIGISWDNEAPPIYQDVPPSPPAYSEESIFDGDCPLDEAAIDSQPLDGPVGGSGSSSGSGTPNRFSIDDVMGGTVEASMVPS